LTKILSAIAIVLMVLHLIRPLGVPGLKRRKDFWKIAVAMIAIILFTALLRD
jgi:hypothetical protein